MEIKSKGTLFPRQQHERLTKLAISGLLLKMSTDIPSLYVVLEMLNFIITETKEGNIVHLRQG